MSKLPTFADITVDPRRSTYYTFSKSNHDLDRCVSSGNKYVFTKMVALNLPLWDPSRTAASFGYKFRRADNAVSPGHIANYSVKDSETFPDLEVDKWDNPNMVIPRVFQYYLENVIAAYCQTNDDRAEMSAELAFWKSLQLLGMSQSDILKSIVFVNNISTSNFVEVSNNHGWCEIIASIPNRCDEIDVSNALEFSTMGFDANLDLTGDNSRHSICDGSSPHLISAEVGRLVFDNINFISTNTPKKFQFNTLLLFYDDNTTDSNGKIIHKLHGIDFILPFEKKTDGTWEMPSFAHQTNDIQTFGYSFKFNMKTVVNDNTKSHVYAVNQNEFYHVFQGAMDKFASLLELISKNPII